MSVESKHVLLLNDYLEHEESSSTDFEPHQTSTTTSNSSALPPPYVSVMQHPSVVHLPPATSSELTDAPRSIRVNQTVADHRHHLPVTHQPNRNEINTTNVITEQPNHLWRSGTFDCCETTSVCLCVCLCPLCYGCSLAKRLNESGFLSCCPGGLAVMRYKYRISNRIQGSALDDVCLSCCCRSCVLCQLGNELNMKQERYPKVCCGCC